MVDHHVRHDAEGGSGSGSGARAPPSEAEKGVVDGDFVLIQREDAVEAIAAFVVEFLARHPRAANLSPAELSALLATALATIRQVQLGAMHICLWAPCWPPYDRRARAMY